jgi:SAM-dependent methyltransferase
MLKWNVEKNGLTVGALHCGSIHETPFDDNTFDIGPCIGVLEYFERGYVESALKEASRILKPSGKFVLDIPNIDTPAGQMMMKIEEYLGRPSKFNLLPVEFENLVEKYYEIAAVYGAKSTGMGILYCLKRRTK